MRRRELLLTPLALGLVGAQVRAGAPQWNGGHPVSDDPLWEPLSAAAVTVDRASGALHAGFRPEIILMAEQIVTVEGFILPLDILRSTNHFALTRRNAGCPFCAPNQPTEAVEVVSVSPVTVGPELTRMRGRLHLHSSSDQGMFYQLTEARRA
ncbi:hypothetical protein KOAAANKH_00748 [Brevundimonas sp. NIBR10]|uniref:hypothetical protein n=1 Tax=Brevundimonas sp. NIBR10 TaxID=3015997 RepID=UPI0022F1AEC9|nr:hypothetical protein [Brevundimonas sp. NIBR10]WGM45883.1 hypothetical protein KOAAANKH_00748 [Brevundimonas sp. NIBR10]